MSDPVIARRKMREKEVDEPLADIVGDVIAHCSRIVADNETYGYETGMRMGALTPLPNQGSRRDSKRIVDIIKASKTKRMHNALPHLKYGRRTRERQDGKQDTIRIDNGVRLDPQLKRRAKAS